MDRQHWNSFVQLVTCSAFALQLIGCAPDADTDVATTSGALASATAAATSDTAVATKVSSTAVLTTSTLRLKPPPTTAVDVPLCPATFNESDYPRHTDKFTDTWPEIHPTAINTLGQVVGSFRPDVNQKLKGFVRQANGSFGPAPWYGPDYDVNVTAMNDLGQFVGYAGSLDDPYGFFDAQGSTVEGYAPLAVNNLGQSVGIHQYSTWHGLFHYTEGFLRDANGQFTSLGAFLPVAINNVGQIAGYSQGEDSSVFDPGTFGIAGVRDPDGHTTFYGLVNKLYMPRPVAMNDLGQVVGYYQDGSGHYHGFFADANGALTSIDFIGDHSETYLRAINNFGQMVGWTRDYQNLDEIRYDFMRDPNGHFIAGGPAGPNGTKIRDAFGINDMGVLVGTYDDGPAIKGFVAGPYFVEPFAAFSVSQAEIVQSTRSFTARGSFTPCSGRTLNPVAGPVLVKVYREGVWWASIAIPANSLTPSTGKYEFHGTVHGVQVDFYLWGPLSDGHWDYTVIASGVAGLPNSNPLTVSLAIGENTGSASVINATIH
jgi:hypothetical protein